MRASFVRAPLAAAGAATSPVGQALTALAIAGQSLDAPVVLTDLSPFARTGFKGVESAQWLSSQGVACPPMPNTAKVQTDGTVVARLSQGEFLILGCPGDSDGRVAELDQAWSWMAGMCFPLPRQDSHAWFLLSGESVPAMMAKLCGVDLRRRVFQDGDVAQTSVARLNAIVIRQDDRYHLLADSASAEYLWSCLIDAMAEFKGSIAGCGHVIAA